MIVKNKAVASSTKGYWSDNLDLHVAQRPESIKKDIIGNISYQLSSFPQ
ncbi:MAG: hypothetical protein AAB858_03215 [Patescibacteria group bacterium]